MREGIYFDMKYHTQAKTVMEKVLQFAPNNKPATDILNRIAVASRH